MLLTKIEINNKVSKFRMALSLLILEMMDLDEKNLNAISNDRTLHQKLREASHFINDALQELDIE